MDVLQTQVTQLLSAAGKGDADAAERLLRLVYDELHRLAHAKLARENGRGDLQTTVLLHEAFLRLMPGNGAAMPENSRQFFAYAANAMRQYLVDDARNRNRIKRGGGRTPLAMTEEPMMFDHDPGEILAVSEVLEKLRAHDPLKAKIVDMRYFSGLSIDETAVVLEMSPRQVDKEWQFARAWLHRELS